MKINLLELAVRCNLQLGVELRISFLLSLGSKIFTKKLKQLTNEILRADLQKLGLIAN